MKKPVQQAGITLLHSRSIRNSDIGSFPFRIDTRDKQIIVNVEDFNMLLEAMWTERRKLHTTQLAFNSPYGRVRNSMLNGLLETSKQTEINLRKLLQNSEIKI